MRVTFQKQTWDFDTYDEDDFIKEMIDLSDGDVNLDHLSGRITQDGLDSYFKFLNFEDFEMDEGVEKTFDFLGYSNESNYPLDYWKCKLHDNRVRDKFYSMGLGNIDPLFNLKDVTEYSQKRYINDIRGKMKGIEDTTFLAGGALCDITCGDLFTRSKDYDLFLTEDIDIYQTISNFPDSSKVTMSRNAITFKANDVYYQYILRLYSCPAEIVYGFDIDASGLIFVDGKIYATHCAEYAIRNLVNYLDFDRFSPSYTKRLIKYGRKGFQIKAPQLIFPPEVIRKGRKIFNIFRWFSSFYKDCRNIIDIDNFTALIIFMTERKDLTLLSRGDASFYIRGDEELRVVIDIDTNKSKEYALMRNNPMTQVTSSFTPLEANAEKYCTWFTNADPNVECILLGRTKYICGNVDGCSILARIRRYDYTKPSSFIIVRNQKVVKKDIRLLLQYSKELMDKIVNTELNGGIKNLMINILGYIEHKYNNNPNVVRLEDIKFDRNYTERSDEIQDNSETSSNWGDSSSEGNNLDEMDTLSLVDSESDEEWR